MQDWIELESLHVVSDLHLGGDVGFQIFGSTDELAWLIDHVATATSPGTHGLLINGDIVDFLAEGPSRYFDPDGAVAKLDSVWQHFEPIFAALQRLLDTPDRLLMINLGNHDLELALPWVRAHLTERVTKGSASAGARLLLVTDGTGVRCRVGSAKVLALHGNEVDGWNVTDHERLRRIGRNCQFGLPFDSWTPNAGTQMVIEVMNQIKRDYPFVDLLKPETGGVLPILAALRPGVHRKLLDLAGIAGRKAWDLTRMRGGFLDAETPAAFPAEGYRPAPVFAAPAPARSRETLLRDVESAWRQGIAPISLVRGTQDQQLGFWSATQDFVTGRPKHEVLREALEHLDHDRSFDPAAPDDTFRELDSMVGVEIDLLLAGHTHLERSVPRSRGRGHYFNSGTWARLIRVEPAVRQNEAAFKSLFSVLNGGTMEVLDNARINFGGVDREVVLRRNTVVLIEADRAAGSVRASLQHVLPANGPQPIRLEPAGAETWTGD
ncbi:metallophosphoesterase [Bradyrhizobium sp. Mp27]|uniref:metallophosphoesterase n=1 Tax=Bradyrhizobium sp. Mp27 TaxID=3042157 RepID=UPI00248A9983|nr:metallophosphoesterase [Bradyrhizobium sp. Mp27]MDI2073053.1 metallophosphoesterase [Bradyrhizobium sp. Mp27]